MFNMLNPREIPSEDLSPLQDAEIRFLDACSDKSGLPYLFKLHSQER